MHDNRPLNLKFQLHNHGFEVHEQACPATLLFQLQNEFPADAAEDAGLLEKSETVRKEALTGIFHETAKEILGEGCVPTQAILYNNNDTAQPWHQDPTAKGLIVRLSLDDCTFFDGALKLCPSSHKHGPLTAQEIRGHSLRPFSSPEMKAGDILIMHPLTIHASAASTTGKPRRVIHIAYASA